MIDPIDDGDRADEPLLVAATRIACWEQVLRYLADRERCMPSERERFMAAFVDIDPEAPPAPATPSALPANAMRHRPGWESR